MVGRVTSDLHRFQFISSDESRLMDQSDSEPTPTSLWGVATLQFTPRPHVAPLEGHLQVFNSGRMTKLMNSR